MDRPVRTALTALPLLFAGCDLGPFGGGEGVEDHRFLIDLRNVSLDSVTFGVVDEDSGFEVQGLDTTTIQRRVDPGRDLMFEARVAETAPPQTIACRYEPPSDVTPRRQIQWDGATLRCLHWE